MALPVVRIQRPAAAQIIPVVVAVVPVRLVKM